MDKVSYPYELKKEVVELYFEGHSVLDLVEKYEIKNRRRVYDWVKKVKEFGYVGLSDQRGINSKGKKKKEESSLEEQLEKVKLENEYLKKLLDLKRG